MTSKQHFEQVHKHEYAERVIPSTCSERGYTLHVCECGDEYKDNFQPLSDHDFRPAGETAPTCEAPGKRFFACSVCGAKKETPIPATGHTFGETETMVYPGCESEGEGKRTCSLCGAVKKVPIPATGHKFDEWFDQKKAGCDAPGEQVRQCPLCGKTETRPLPALGHDMTEWAVSKTDPNKDERFCRRCGLTETREGQDALTLCADGIVALQIGDRDAAREKLRLAAEKGLAEAQYEYGVLLRDAPDKKGADVDAAIGWLTKSAEQNYAPAMVALANTYSEMKRDRKQAMVWYRKAAEAGSVEAKEALAKTNKEKKIAFARCGFDSCNLLTAIAFLILTILSSNNFSEIIMIIAGGFLVAEMICPTVFFTVYMNKLNIQYLESAERRMTVLLILGMVHGLFAMLSFAPFCFYVSILISISEVALMAFSAVKQWMAHRKPTGQTTR